MTRCKSERWSTFFSRWSLSFFITGKTGEILVSTCSELRTSMYSFDSRHLVHALSSLQYLIGEAAFE
jgi:hypothetical protein